ncbi:MAG: hydantoinase/oxoprolinase family protein [Bradyrhizobium sp.]|nr:hydantoinase/oxoprolinase family protein [Bradyrhizobium sp.]
MQAKRSANWQVGIDIGGTFTDIVARNLETGEQRLTKVRSRIDDPLEGLVAAISATGLLWEDVSDLIHGTTIVTNAIVKNELATTALVTTEGFSDTLDIGRQNRLHLYKLDLPPKHPSIVPRPLRVEVGGRMSWKGEELEPLEENDLDRLVRSVAASGAQSVAVCLLHAYANPAHEIEIGRRLAKVAPYVTLSHQVNPEPREFERMTTTVLSAGVKAAVVDYVEKLLARKPEHSRLHFFHSASGMCSPNLLLEQPLAIAVSGPAAGVSATCELAKDLNISHAVTFDMGGTTTDVSLVVDGKARVTANRTLAGRALRMPAVDVDSIGAGGGSLATWDGHRLSVGPKSAGSDPGPACYGRGGQIPTVSDANMLLGYLEDGAVFGGTVKLSADAAKSVLTPLSKQLQQSLTATAAGIVNVADNLMASMLQRVSVGQGVDIRRFTMVAFGGAGPMHAVNVARLAGIEKVIVPSGSGAFSALGCLVAAPSYTQQRAFSMTSRNWNADLAEAHCAAVERDVRAALASDRSDLVRSRVLSLRYTGQSHSVEIDDPTTLEPAEMEALLKEKHESLYGFSCGDGWELVGVRVTVTAPVLSLPFSNVEGSSAKPINWRTCSFGQMYDVRTPVFNRQTLPVGEKIQGPALIVDDASTIVLPPGSNASRDRHGHVHIEVR